MRHWHIRRRSGKPRVQAGAAGDLETVHLCHAALEGDEDARDEVEACILWAREMAAEGGEHE